MKLAITTGYRGRKAVYEVIPIDRELRSLIREQQLDVADLLVKKEIKTLKENAFSLLLSGETSLEEIRPMLS